MNKTLLAAFLIATATSQFAMAETGAEAASSAGRVLGNPNSSPDEKSAAASALAQTPSADVAAPAKKHHKKAKKHKAKKHYKAKVAPAEAAAPAAEAAPAAPAAQ